MPEPDPAPDGAVLVQAAWAGTAVFATSALAATAVEALTVLSVPIALLLFLGGTIAFTSAYVQALQRSRDDEIAVADLFFLTHCAPKPVRRAFMAALAVEIVVALLTASLRLYTGLAFGIMTPMWALGLAGLWGARYGTFRPRATKD